MKPNQDEIQQEMLFNRLLKREKHLRKWARRVPTEAYRLYDRDIPEIPLLIERWGGAVTAALYKRPYEKDETEEARWFQGMIRAISEALKVPEGRIFPRIRERQRGKAQYQRLREPDGRPGEGQGEVREGDLLFRVNLSEYLDPGLFLDRRRLRFRVQAEAGGLRVLNLFAYTCGFSLAAAQGGAAEVDSVDLSRTYLEWGRINFALNGLSISAEKRRFIQGDVLEFIGEAERAGRRWDLIILDPPEFSNSKRMAADFDLLRDHPALLRRCMGLLAPRGTLYFSAPGRKFSFSEEGLPPGGEDLTEALRDEDLRGRLPRCRRFVNS
jgi:23S rRNA G2069 N7-methylase RlmK/C1962 C5-methylase RlmI